MTTLIFIFIFSKEYLLLRWCDYYTLQIIIADLLLKTGEFINPHGDYLNSLEYKDAHATLRTASEGICDSVYAISNRGQHDLANAYMPSSMSSIRALSVIWVIGCALKASTSEGLDREAAEGILQMISDQYRIPLAFGVVCYHSGPFYSSFLINEASQLFNQPYVVGCTRGITIGSSSLDRRDYLLHQSLEHGYSIPPAYGQDFFFKRPHSS